MARDTLLGFPAHTLPYRCGGFTTLLTVSTDRLSGPFSLDKTVGKRYVKANRGSSLTLKGENANGLFLLR